MGIRARRKSLLVALERAHDVSKPLWLRQSATKLALAIKNKRRSGARKAVK